MRRPWLYPLLLAVPFLAGIVALEGLTEEIATFHGSDARVYHLPTIRQFADALPGIGLERYPAAQTPLYHVLFALASKVVGLEELWRLRLLNVIVAYLAVLVLFRWLVRSFGLERPAAFALSLVFALSPYFFGASFTFLTDNLAILFGLLALERFHRFTSERTLPGFALGCLWLSAAVLTRQSFLWLALVAAWALLRGSPRRRERLAGAGLVALALAPFAALVAVWGGLVPPSADPASCGLCTDTPGVGRDALTLRTVGFTLALAGLYAAAIHLPRLRRIRLDPRLAAPVLAGLVLLVVSPLVYKPVVPGQPGDAGYLWKLADRTPELAGSELLFWLLVPAGALAVFLLVRRAGWLSLEAAFLASFLAAALPVSLVYQKYFDPFVLLALALLVRPGDFRRTRDYAGLAALAAAFTVYALTAPGST